MFCSCIRERERDERSRCGCGATSMMSASACSSRLSIEMFGAPRERERDRERERERRKPGPPASSCRCSCLSLACWFSLPKSQYLNSNFQSPFRFNYYFTYWHGYVDCCSSAVCTLALWIPSPCCPTKRWPQRSHSIGLFAIQAATWVCICLM
jgi:hypothetical protein